MQRLLITGATSGIGEAVALLAAKNGFHVIACGRNQTKLNTLAQQPNISICQFDVTDLAATKTALAEVECDIALLNAGTCEYVDSNSVEAGMFQRVFDANVFGVVNVIEALTPQLVAGNKLVFVDSLARLLPFSRSQAYGASKAALHYMAVRIERHVCEQDEHLLLFFYGEVLCCSQRHIRYEQALHRRPFSSIDKADNAVERASLFEHLPEIEVVVIGQPDTAQDDAVSSGAQGHGSHNRIERLIGVSEKGDFLPGHQGVVQVYAGNAGGDELRGLFPPDRVDRWPAYFSPLPGHLRAAVYWLAIGIKETAGQGIADLQARRFPQKDDLCICRYALCACENL